MCPVLGFGCLVFLFPQRAFDRWPTPVWGIFNMGKIGRLQPCWKVTSVIPVRCVAVNRILVILPIFLRSLCRCSKSWGEKWVTTITKQIFYGRTKKKVLRKRVTNLLTDKQNHIKKFGGIFLLNASKIATTIYTQTGLRKSSKSQNASESNPSNVPPPTTRSSRRNQVHVINPSLWIVSEGVLVLEP